MKDSLAVIAPSELGRRLASRLPVATPPTAAAKIGLSFESGDRFTPGGSSRTRASAPMF